MIQQHPIAVTSGEPAGIGPDLCVQLANSTRQFNIVVFADKTLLQQRAAELNLAVEIIDYPTQTPQLSGAGVLWVKHIAMASACQPGQLQKENAHYVISQLQQAAEACQAQQYAALITCPVQKSVINDAGIPFTGHTEFFAHHAGREKVVMMLANAKMRVALVTTHLPLKQVPQAISYNNVKQTISLVAQGLQQQFGIKKPRLLVCGLNPHAGENGHLGREEIEIIEPAIQALKAQGVAVTGPLPADTLFTEKYLNHADAVIAMYHDQGLPVLKSHGFGETVNITLGLPYFRASVDHGTALDLAGSGQASPSSLVAALDLTQQSLAQQSPHSQS